MNIASGDPSGSFGMGASLSRNGTLATRNINPSSTPAMVGRHFFIFKIRLVSSKQIRAQRQPELPQGVGRNLAPRGESLPRPAAQRSAGRDFAEKEISVFESVNVAR